MDKLGITKGMLTATGTTFHGMVPGLSCTPMGKVWLDVLFGDKENCRCEHLLFEVVDLKSPYHALLGRTALAKFMASTHMPYLKMKMPGPEGVITIVGDYRKSLECASDGSKLAEAMVIANEKKRIAEVVALAQTVKLEEPATSAPQSGMAFQAARESKRIRVDEANPEHTVIIGAGLEEK